MVFHQSGIHSQMTAIGDASILIIVTAVNADSTFFHCFHFFYQHFQSFKSFRMYTGSQKGGENTLVGHSMPLTSKFCG